MLTSPLKLSLQQPVKMSLYVFEVIYVVKSRNHAKFVSSIEVALLPTSSVPRFDARTYVRWNSDKRDAFGSWPRVPFVTLLNSSGRPNSDFGRNFSFCYPAEFQIPCCLTHRASF